MSKVVLTYFGRFNLDAEFIKRQLEPGILEAVVAFETLNLEVWYKRKLNIRRGEE